MQNLKVRCLGSLPSGGKHFGFFKFSCDSVESTDSIESKANYGKTRILIQGVQLNRGVSSLQRKQSGNACCDS